MTNDNLAAELALYTTVQDLARRRGQDSDQLKLPEQRQHVRDQCEHTGSATGPKPQKTSDAALSTSEDFSNHGTMAAPCIG